MGLSKAVSTSTVREKAAALLQRSNLLHYFPVLVCGDEVPVAKPDPAIFLEAAKRLKVEPSRCLVFEDSSPGNQAEHAAGMIPILVPDTVSRRLKPRERIVFTDIDRRFELFRSPSDTNPLLADQGNQEKPYTAGEHTKTI